MVDGIDSIEVDVFNIATAAVNFTVIDVVIGIGITVVFTDVVDAAMVVLSYPDVPHVFSTVYRKFHREKV